MSSRWFKLCKSKLIGILLIFVLFLAMSCTAAATEGKNIRAMRTSFLTPYYIDPAVGYDYASSVLLVNIHDPLVAPNEDGREVVPHVAKSWTVSDDSLTYTFEIRPGIKFHNGDELTAEDVAFSLQRMLDIGEGYAYLFIGIVDKIEVLDEYKLRITNSKPFGPFLQTLVKCGIVNKSQVMAHLGDGPYGEFGDYGKNWLLRNDAASGPYKVLSIEMNSHISLEKFGDYWAGWENENAPEYVEIVATLEAATSQNLLANGSLEMTSFGYAPEIFDQWDKLPNVDIASWFDSQFYNFLLNNKKPPTDDVHFRRALNYILDRETVYESIFPGSRPIAIVPESLPGSDPNLEGFKKNIDKAKEELQKSPYYEELDNYPIEVYYPSEATQLPPLALLFQANCAEIGITVDIRAVPWLTIVETAASVESAPNAGIINIAANYPEAGAILESLFHQKSKGTWEQLAWLEEPELDAKIDDAVATIDNEERYQKYYAIQEELFPRAINVQICEWPQRVAFREDYVVIPAYERTKKGLEANPILGYCFYFRDYQIFPEKANDPYTPFIP